MVGARGSGKDESVMINSTNAYAALGSLRKKKKKDFESRGPTAGGNKAKEQEKEVFWAPAPLTVKSWADVDDEDDDDYYATTAPPASVWGSAHSDPKVGKEAAVEESESEEEGLDEVDDIDDERDDEHEHEISVQLELIKKPADATLVHKDTERQLSKKELKKKGLEELDAVLAELGYAKKETSSDDFHGSAQDKKGDNEELGKKENAAGESKSARKKKKKEKSLKEAKDFQDQPVDASAGHGADETAQTEKAEDASAIDVKERLKKVVATKKKKSSKDMDAAARAAASEAAARNAKLAAAKKKEKSHYNQQPMR
ncbi:hypothetical protein K2173_010979 [Erythroxylum novogranatense]|uniref:Uncharacterized protein n=1 Tax=Erythroxylum novogranatense TaxID=1862640 RepID=A0AAV8T0P5_9ROSI|nr:hypothetical protein K2173_010979 [Erythroxylum novogranatense]